VEERPLKMTSVEEKAAERLVANLRRFRDKKPRFNWIRKLKKGDSIPAYREEVRAKCEEMLDQLLEEFKETSPEDAGNDGSAD